MTIENLKIAIAKLIIKRQNEQNTENIKKINEKLDKLYNIKYLYYEQEQKFICTNCTNY